MMIHGADIYTYSKIAGCEPHELIDFSSNINLYQPNNNITLTNATITKYAESNYSSLKERIAKNYAIESDQIALYNGATAAISSLLSQLEPKKVHLYAPLYGEYEKALLSSKKSLSRINRISDIKNVPDKNSIVIFVNPSTPDGEYHKLQKLFKLWKKHKCTIIIDESFLEFEELASCRDEIKEYKKLYIIQSFTKFYACAGVRIGALFSHKKNIKKLKRELWNISSLDAEFLEWRLGDEEFKRKSRELHKLQKAELNALLEESGLFDEIAESQANFILVHTPFGKKLFEYLLSRKILVRSCESFEYLDENWLRFAVKDAESQKSLRAALLAFKS